MEGAGVMPRKSGGTGKAFRFGGPKLLPAGEVGQAMEWKGEGGLRVGECLGWCG